MLRKAEKGVLKEVEVAAAFGGRGSSSLLRL
jgi:hypothetical protein